MNITVFGADGRTGQHVVREALALGHDVTAFAYDESYTSRAPQGVRVITGDIMQASDVAQAITKDSCVVSVVGHIKNSDPRMQTKGAQNVIDAMKKVGATRIVSLTGTGVRIPHDTPSFFDRIANIAIGLIDPQRIADGKEHAQALQKSGLNWTILRVLKLSNTPHTKHNHCLTRHGPAEFLTPRQKAARILVDLVTNNTYIHDMPVSSKTCV